MFYFKICQENREKTSLNPSKQSVTHRKHHSEGTHPSTPLQRTS